MTANNQTDETGQTIKDVCEQRQLSTQSIGVKFRRKFGTGYSVHLVPTDEQFAVLFGNIKTRKQPTVNKTGAAITFQNTGTLAAKTQAPKAAPVKKEWLTRDGILIFTVAAPTIASVHNMYRVSDTIMGNTIDALALTVVLSCTGLAMVYTGIRNWPGILLTSLVILYESFANTVRIYQGMWQNGNPSRFLGSVCDIFGSGSHYTAISLGVLIASIVALTQYIVFFQLKRDA